MARSTKPISPHASTSERDAAARSMGVWVAGYGLVFPRDDGWWTRGRASARRAPDAEVQAAIDAWERRLYVLDGPPRQATSPTPKATRAPRRTSEEVQAEARAKRAEGHDRLRAAFPNIIIFDVTEAKGPEAKAAALLAQIRAHNEGGK